MEAGTLSPATANKNRRVVFATAPLALAAVGGVVGIIGVFLKGMNAPAGYTGSTTYINLVGGAKVALGALVVGLVFLALARAVQRKRVLWGAHLASLVAILMTGLAAGGFTLTTVTGDSVSASATYGVFVALAGSIVLLVGSIAMRRSAQPA